MSLNELQELTADAECNASFLHNNAKKANKATMKLVHGKYEDPLFPASEASILSKM